MSPTQPIPQYQPVGVQQILAAQQPSQIQQNVMSPQMRRQTLLSNLSQNFTALGRREKPISPAAALAAARGQQMELQTKQAYTDQVRLTQAQQQAEAANAQQKQQILSAINQQYGNDPKAKYQAMMDSGLQDVALAYAKAMKDAGMPIIEKPEDPLKDVTGNFKNYLVANNLKPNDPGAYDAFLESELKKSRASATKVNIGQDENFKDTTALRKEFNDLPETKLWGEIKTQVGRLDKAMEEAKDTKSNVAVDQSLIMVFNKMLDPESVVRESEYARTPQDLSLLSRIKGKWDKIQKGGAGLNSEEREAMYRMARKFAAVAQDDYQLRRDQYGELADEFGLKRKHIFGSEYSPIDFSDEDKTDTTGDVIQPQPIQSGGVPNIQLPEGWSIRPK